MAAHSRGYRVAATARNVSDLSSLVDESKGAIRGYALDVTDHASVRDAVAAVHQELGSLDVVVLNAGRGLLGALEELSDEQILANLDVNLNGPLRVLRAAVPLMRRQRSGVIVNMSAIAASSTHPGFTIYGGAKAAVEALCDALRAEVAPLGITVMNVEPGPFRTDFIARSLERTGSVHPDYAATVGKFGAILNSINGKQPGDPARAADAILTAAESPNPPSRLVLGNYAYKQARQRLAQLARELDEWEATAVATDFA
jgi:NAD(P)-dependent dehydrogenase (short-subunit alcohol dehydrogenase family)